MCAIDGNISLRLVPHIYRQEMKPGATTSYHHEYKGHELIV